MSRLIRTLAAGALLSTLAACYVESSHLAPRPVPGPTPHDISMERLHQVDGRIENLGHRIDTHVSQGIYPPPQGAALHHHLDEIRGEAHNMAEQHGGGLSPDEQRVLNEELDTAAHAVER